MEFRNSACKHAPKKSSYLKKSPDIEKIVLNPKSHELDTTDFKEFDFIRLQSSEKFDAFQKVNLGYFARDFPEIGKG